MNSRNQIEGMKEIINNIKEDINHARGDMEGLRDNIIDRENGLEFYKNNLKKLKDDFTYHKPEDKKNKRIRTKTEGFLSEIEDKKRDIEYCIKDIKGYKLQQFKTKNGMIARTYILNVLEENINQQLEKDKHAFDNLEEIGIDEDTIDCEDGEPAYSPNQGKEIKGSEYHE